MSDKQGERIHRKKAALIKPKIWLYSAIGLPLVIFASTLIYNNAQAADIRYSTVGGFSIIIEGEIVAGDAEVFRSKLEDARARVESVILYSSGGRLYEAMEIGELIRDLALTTYAPQGECHALDPQNCICASACFFIHAGGLARYGTDTYVHRPYFDPEDFAGLSFAAAQVAYSQMIEEANLYLQEMNVPPEIIQFVFEPPPDEALALAPSDLDLSMYEIYGDYIGQSEILSTWLNSRCGTILDDDLYVYYSIGRNSPPPDFDALTEDERAFQNRIGMSLERFYELGGERSSCEYRSQREARREAYVAAFGESALYDHDLGWISMADFWITLHDFLGEPFNAPEASGWYLGSPGFWILETNIEQIGPLTLFAFGEGDTINSVSIDYTMFRNPSAQPFSREDVENFVRDIYWYAGDPEDTIISATGWETWGTIRWEDGDGVMRCVADGLVRDSGFELLASLSCRLQ